MLGGDGISHHLPQRFRSFAYTIVSLRLLRLTYLSYQNFADSFRRLLSWKILNTYMVSYSDVYIGPSQKRLFHLRGKSEKDAGNTRAT